MLLEGAWPRGIDQRQACLTHLETCPSCRAAAGSLGEELATLTDFSAPVGRVRELLIPNTYLGSLVFSGETYRVDWVVTVPGDGLATRNPVRTNTQTDMAGPDAKQTTD